MMETVLVGCSTEAPGPAAQQRSEPLSSAALLEQFWTQTYSAAPAAGAAAVTESAVDPAVTTSLGDVCVPRYDIELLAKARPDECFYGLCEASNLCSFSYPGDLDEAQCIAEGGHPKVNQAYVWGLTMAGDDVWFGTAANVLCLVLSGFFGAGAPLQTDAVVCEDACEGEVTCPGRTPIPFIDARPPRFFRYNAASGQLTDETPQVLGQDPSLLLQTYGIRSAGSHGGVVLFGGLTGDVTGTSSRVVMYAFDATDYHYIGANKFDEYTDIRQWIVANKELYVGVGTATGGEVLRWTGSPSAPFSFETVGILEGDPAYLAEHKGRIFAHTWPVIEDEDDTVSLQGGGILYMSPPFGSDRKLGNADAGDWQPVWNLHDDYEVEPSAFLVGGAIASYGPYLYFGTMQVPGLGALLFCEEHPERCSTPADLVAAFLGTLRPIVVFRGRDFGTPRQKVELLYGTPYLPRYNGERWEIVPNNMGGAWPKFGLAGMNNLFNTYTWWMENYHGRLFVGTFDWLYLLLGGLEDVLHVPVPESLRQLALQFAGADLFRFVSMDSPAIPVSLSGIGNYTNYGIRTMVAGKKLYLGTANPMNLLTDKTDDVPEGGWELRELSIEDCDGD